MPKQIPPFLLNQPVFGTQNMPYEFNNYEYFECSSFNPVMVGSDKYYQDALGDFFPPAGQPLKSFCTEAAINTSFETNVKGNEVASFCIWIEHKYEASLIENYFGSADGAGAELIVRCSSTARNKLTFIYGDASYTTAALLTLGRCYEVTCDIAGNEATFVISDALCDEVLLSTVLTNVAGSLPERTLWVFAKNASTPTYGKRKIQYLEIIKTDGEVKEYWFDASDDGGVYDGNGAFYPNLIQGTYSKVGFYDLNHSNHVGYHVGDSDTDYTLDVRRQVYTTGIDDFIYRRVGVTNKSVAYNVSPAAPQLAVSSVARSKHSLQCDGTFKYNILKGIKTGRGLLESLPLSVDFQYTETDQQFYYLLGAANYEWSDVLAVDFFQDFDTVKSFELWTPDQSAVSIDINTIVPDNNYRLKVWADENGAINMALFNIDADGVEGSQFGSTVKSVDGETSVITNTMEMYIGAEVELSEFGSLMYYTPTHLMLHQYQVSGETFYFDNESGAIIFGDNDSAHLIISDSELASINSLYEVSVNGRTRYDGEVSYRIGSGNIAIEANKFVLPRGVIIPLDTSVVTMEQVTCEYLGRTQFPVKVSETGVFLPDCYEAKACSKVMAGSGWGITLGTDEIPWASFSKDIEDRHTMFSDLTDASSEGVFFAYLSNLTEVEQVYLMPSLARMQAFIGTE